MRALVSYLLLLAAAPCGGLRMVATGPQVNVAPQRTRPGAGVIPEWANRGPGRCPEPSQFLSSDQDSADLSGLRECPLTRWDSEVPSVKAAQEEARRAVKARGAFPLEMNADSATNAAGVEYFRQNKDAIRAAMKKHGCVWLRGFELMQDVKGYRQMWEALGLLPCLDPIHSSGLRKFASERDGCYEEVNKPSLRGHYIGLHQESTAKRTAAAAAFVCFKRATEEGGRFTIADGAEILADMKTDTLERLYEDGVRISVSNLDTPFTQEEGVVGAVRGAFKGLVQTAVAPKFDMDLEMIWEADGKPGRLQAVEDCEPPINRHPETGVPVWFCNAHNHLRYLRDRRPCGVPEVGMTDVFRGPSLEKISDEDADEIKRVSEKNIVALPMEPGDVLLIDNYRALHGRETFKGDRFHAVTWFSWDNPEWRVGAEEGSDDSKDVMNKIVNKYLDWLPKDF
mmetsp:Transcript_6274/g.24453  ORF Transcript_6274/g.24453 Transcript_6274/m.24453 type:complete len:454 (-) Transcript_6274:36-1397(-)